jgi:uncharacterized membrane protein
MTRREFTNAAERQAAEATALAEAARTGHYRQPEPPVDPAEHQRIIEAAMRCLDPATAQSQVARELRAAGADDQTVMRAMRQVHQAVAKQATRHASAAGDRRAEQALARLRGGPFQAGQVR